MKKKIQRIDSRSASRYRYTVCLDTNIVISMAGVAYGDKEEIDMLISSHKYDSICKLAEAIKKGQVIAVITPVVLQELLQCANRDGARLMDFFKKSQFRLLDMPEEELEQHFKEVEKLAEYYSKKISPQKLSSIAKQYKLSTNSIASRPFSVKRDKQTGEIVVDNDARIMAESVLLGVKLVTNNTHHFLYGHRPLLISHINATHGHNPRAQPHTSENIMQMYHNGAFFPVIHLNSASLLPAKSLDLANVTAATNAAHNNPPTASDDLVK